ncbi:S1 family peptidase, partial [Cellulomonas septica]|nr:S1 family peptidase [Cellulomonas septica]
MRRMHSKTLATLGLATTLVLAPAVAQAATSDPDVGAPAPVTAPKVANGVLDAMKRDLGLSGSAARDRLAFQAGAAETEQRL